MQFKGVLPCKVGVESNLASNGLFLFQAAKRRVGVGCRTKLEPIRPRTRVKVGI